ncbi:protein-disulfide reductase DsbD [Edwardsiella piscicida]|uniref:protein-disulfide reductase DsbD n=1 Tax=Edwardsiella piscicida TaxID=1263550 RepID=UPI000934110C|nr:protein-disulfide reductase DsbD [Edwardsiella piscicida]EKS7792721.1 protein-disulfide reductase DsbD [Edwardsiella piscicida]EKS7814396.1 protein-disulfide reductase DsbD [Edwardsiella piscicida]ELM3727436.1 protein-disulfide reductase DsbD [Edwardsiella piscicida]ELV7536517.1 protein-disulfide reductase DsbD [Edwardsiella piscicida]UCQ21399.1 protein-disulfide reductase DsbD [Edwardsiella piscicida]
MAQRIFALIALFITTLLPAQASLFGEQPRFVPVNQAFAFDFQQRGEHLTLRWQIQPGYYLYRQQIRITPHQAQLGPWQLPPGIPHHDEFQGETAIFRDGLSLTLPLLSAAAGGEISVTYQGCAAAGFCYPPETRRIPLEAITATAGALPSPGAATAAANTEHAPTLPFPALWALLIGIGIAFTPCVLPMYPLISALILGQKQRHGWGHTALLALVYVQGMAITYTVLGMVVAAAGLRFQAAFQHPYVLIGLSLLFILLALSMFGAFTLQLPASLQTRLTLWSNRQRSGSLLGVFVMGALAGLICSPCTTAPLSAILLYIAQSGNLWVGGGTLYLYALGMGIPLIAVTLFGNRLLPRSGPWMQHVKEGFGFVILALPVFLLERILGEAWGMRLWSLLGIAFFLWGFSLSLHARRRGTRLWQILLLGAALICARPLQDWVFDGAPRASTGVSETLAFQPIDSPQQLAQALAQAKARRQPVMLDFYADWCTACKEFEKYTFSNDAVRSQLAGTLLLQANVTANTEQHAQLLQQLNVLGLPSILFFTPDGQPLDNARVTGFMDAERFLAHLRQLPQAQ